MNGVCTSVMRGTFKELSQAEVIQLLIMNRKTGRLLMTENGDQVVIFFHDGRIIDAEGVDTTGEEAFYEPFYWDVGSFEFIPEDVERESRIEANWQRLLFGASNRLGELEKLRESVGYSFSIPSLTTTFDASLYEGTELERRILGSINGKRSIRDISRRTKLKVPELLERISELMDTGLIEIERTPITNQLQAILNRFIGHAGRELIDREERRFGHNLELASRDEMEELCNNAETFALEYTSRPEARTLHRELRDFVSTLFAPGS